MKGSQDHSSIFIQLTYVHLFRLTLLPFIHQLFRPASLFTVFILFMCTIFHSLHGMDRLISTGLSLLRVFILNFDAIVFDHFACKPFVYHLFDAHISNVANLISVFTKQHSFFGIEAISHDVRTFPNPLCIISELSRCSSSHPTYFVK